MSNQPDNYDGNQTGESEGQSSRGPDGGREPPQGADQQGNQPSQQGYDNRASQQGGPHAQQQAPEQAVHHGPSLSDKLKRPRVLNQIKLTVVTYIVVGAGLGLTGYLILGQLMGGGSGEGSFAASLIGGVAAISITLTTVLLGTTIASVFGLRLADAVPEDDSTTAVASTVGCYAGCVLMALVAVVFIGAQLGGGGGSSSAQSAASSSGGFSVEAGKLFVPILVSGIPAGLVGGAVAYLKRTILPGEFSATPGRNAEPADQPAD